MQYFLLYDLLFEQRFLNDKNPCTDWQKPFCTGVFKRKDSEKQFGVLKQFYIGISNEMKEKIEFIVYKAQKIKQNKVKTEK